MLPLRKNEGRAGGFVYSGFSLKYKLLIVFALLVLVSTAIENFFITRQARYGILEGLTATSKVVESKFNVIFELSESVKEMSFSLTNAMREQTKGSNEVLSAIKSINEATSEVHQDSTEMLRGSKEVATEMKKLDGLTRVISDSMNEMTIGAVEISNAMQEVANISRKNKDSINSLVSEVEHFKV